MQVIRRDYDGFAGWVSSQGGNARVCVCVELETLGSVWGQQTRASTVPEASTDCHLPGDAKVAGATAARPGGSAARWDGSSPQADRMSQQAHFLSLLIRTKQREAHCLRGQTHGTP